jgi:hypothetical protein
LSAIPSTACRMVKVLAVSIAVTKPNHASAEATPDSDFTRNRKSVTNPPAKTK